MSKIAALTGDNTTAVNLMVSLYSFEMTGVPDQFLSLVNLVHGLKLFKPDTEIRGVL